jgi:hypothetical protein
VRAEAFEELLREIETADTANLPGIVGQLEQLCAAAWVRIRLTVAPAAPAAEEWLRPDQAAPLLRTSVKSLTRRWRRLPFCRPSFTGKGYVVSLTGLRDFMRRANQ